MSIFNIHDHRSSDKETQCDVVFEVDCRDWRNLGLPRSTEDWTTWSSNTTIYEASMQAGRIKGLVTLFLYDSGKIKREFEELTWIHPALTDRPYDPTEAHKKKLLTVY